MGGSELKPARRSLNASPAAISLAAYMWLMPDEGMQNDMYNLACWVYGANPTANAGVGPHGEDNHSRRRTARYRPA